MSDSPRAAFMRRALESADRARAAGAPIVSSIAAAQAALESNYGQSKLAYNALNLFGVKSGRSWTGATITMPTTEYENGHPVPALATFRLYHSWEECFSDYGHIIATHSWYADCVDAAAANNAKAFLRGLVDHDGPRDIAQWSTDPNYFDKVWSIAVRWSLVSAEG